MRRYADAATPEAQRAPRQVRPQGRYRYVRRRWRLLFALVDRLGAAARSWLGVGSVPPPRPIDQPRSILLVQLDHLGDAIISTALLPVLRQTFVHARIEVLCGAWNSELFSNCPEVDVVHVSRVNRFARRGYGMWIPAILWWGWKLRSRRFDWAIDVRGEFPLALLVWLSGAPRRIGWNCGGGGFLLTDSPKFVPGRAEVESRFALIEAAGVSLTPQDRRGPRVVPDEAARQRVAREIAAWCDEENPLFVLHIGAGTQAKRWPVGHWRELVGRLIVEHGAKIVLVGDGRERHLGRSILAGAPRDCVADWTGRLGITGLAALLERADVAVGADSGPAHLAAAVGTPVVVLFSGTNDVEQWKPWGSHVAVLRQQVACSPCHRTQCVWADHVCMTQLRPEQVAQAVARFAVRPAKPARAAPRERTAGTSAVDTPWHATSAVSRGEKRAER